MTFAEMRTAVTDYCHLTSADAILRVGKSLNRHYRRITSLVGLDTTRFITRIVSTTPGSRTVTFLEIEKIDRITDATTPTATRTLTQVSMNTQRTTQPGNSAPSTWALQNTDADSVTVLLDTVPQGFYSLQADGWSTLVTLVADSDEPIFAESFHDVLVSFVTSEELLKKEKDTLSDRYLARAEKLLSELRFHYADTHSQDTVQASADQSMRAGFSGTGGGGPAPVEGYVTVTGAPVNNAVAVFTDHDTITGSNPGFTYDGQTVQVFSPAASAEAALTLSKSRTELPAKATLRLNGYSPSIELLDKDFATNWFIGINDDFGDALEIGVGAYSTGVAPIIRVDKTLNEVGLPWGRLRFPVAGGGSTDPSTLDAYSELAWSPRIAGTSGSSGNGYSLQSGLCTKIGRLVIAEFTVALAVKGTNPGNIAIDGFPFAAGSGASSCQVQFYGLATSWISVRAQMQVGTQYAILYGSSATPFTNNIFAPLSDADIANGTDIRGVMMYQTAT